ncbi:MAG: recombination protein RecR [Flavobacteriales bacterium]|nr:recombination protein RecR [Flavobacteriales bacterium]
MQIPSKFLEKATEQIATLPGIGKRTALRLALDLHRRSSEDVRLFVEAILELKLNTHSCSQCHNLSDLPVCGICNDQRRDVSVICVVEDIRDIMAIENTEGYRGLYHVLGGIISPMDGIGPKDLNIDSLVKRVLNPEVKEVIFATSPTMEGDTTNFYLFKLLQKDGLSITALSRGVSVGSELQFADEVTLIRSILQRQEFKLTF